ATKEMDGACMGIWRPHGPHGPILAQFISPGPKCAVLGATGHLALNPTKTKALAYSIPKAKLPPITSCFPGPCDFVPPTITRNGKHISPTQHICGLPKIKTEIKLGHETPLLPAPHDAHTCAPSP
ncbi:ODF3A protein, partial [Rostratula benghalensis]|nr:ODF3A protein [Rostratula benghalensis]